MTDHAGAPQVTVVVVVYETLSVCWYDRTDLAFACAIYETKVVLLLVWCGAFANEFLTRYSFKKSQISFWCDASELVKPACLSHVTFLFDGICVQANQQNAGRSPLLCFNHRRCRGEYCCHTCNRTIANITAPNYRIIIITTTYSCVHTHTHTHT